METVVGSPVIRVDALEKVRGAAVFGADVRLVGMLYGAALRSPYAHARILSIDASEALKLHGVRAVATGADMPDVLAGEGIKDMPFLAVDRVRYVGEPVAAVAADDRGDGAQGRQAHQGGVRGAAAGAGRAWRPWSRTRPSCTRA